MRSYILLLVLLSASCSHQKITNLIDNRLVFSGIESDYKVVDLQNFGCDPISHTNIEHVLLTGKSITAMDVRDHYSTIGCTISGTVSIDGQNKNFKFDYGGVLYIEDDLILGCAQLCCENEFENCTWEP